MKTQSAFIGALVAAAVVIAVVAATGFPIAAFGVFAGLAIVGYIVGRLTADSAAGDATRGVLIGMNSGLNVTLAFVVGREIFGEDTPAGVVAAVIGAMNFLTVFPVISNSEVFQGFLGWFNWFMPMSWLVVALGLGFFLVSVLGHLILYPGPKWQVFRIIGLHADWKTGTWFMHGGWVSNANPIDTAFNMGNFSFVDQHSSQLHMEHEAGHTLNLAAFGSVFHFVGALDENVFGGGASAYSERFAESNVPATGHGDIIPMWI
ncbi:MAG: hypothetical protein GEU75_02290 [Dehalococcoidia bacterium]|nr:hypothetical protein [Dehalococcoidia bacterium]